MLNFHIHIRNDDFLNMIKMIYGMIWTSSSFMYSRYTSWYGQMRFPESLTMYRYKRRIVMSAAVLHCDRFPDVCVHAQSLGRPIFDLRCMFGRTNIINALLLDVSGHV